MVHGCSLCDHQHGVDGSLDKGLVNPFRIILPKTREN